MIRVFLADDEPWVLLGLKSLIDWGSLGFLICGEATDGIKAWERICRLKPDLIISDIRMPGLTGIELIQKIREEKLQAEVVFISGYSEFEYARAGLQYGCIDYLVKPVYEEDIRNCLQRVSARMKGGNAWKEAEPDAEEEKVYLSEARLAEEMLQYMRENYRNVTQQQLAESFNLSASGVSQIIKKHTGKNYGEHLLDIRIQKAEELLRQTNESIETIAEMTGYNDYFYFVKVFKKATGISPSAFRRGL